jgi:hypothetical protein
MVECAFVPFAEARAAQTFPWQPTRVSLHRTIFPQKTNWLPEDEGAQLRFAFETELARLEAVRRDAIRETRFDG